MASYPALEIRFPSGPGADAVQDLLYAALDDFSPVAIHDLDDGEGWRVFFRAAESRNAAREALESSAAGHALALRSVEIDDEDWARRSQSALTAVQIGRIVVAPPWDPAADRTAAGGSTLSPSEPITIVIEPSTGFGTGHHATTRLCLELLQEIPLAGKSVIDVGTGSGLLAIAAWKLGASPVVAVDIDPDALDNARQNLARNGGEGHAEIVEGAIETLDLTRADVVLANLTGAMLRRCSERLMALSRPDAVAILSGFGPEDSHAIASAWTGWSVRDRRREGDWAGLALRKTAGSGF